MTGDGLLRRTGLALVPAAACCGQSTPPVTITYHLTFTEVSAQAPYAPVASPNGLLEPGEGARFELNASISPPPGAAITWPWTVHVNSTGAGTVGGFWSGDLNLAGVGGGSDTFGTWILDANTSPPTNPLRLGVLAPFAAGYAFGANGLPNANGSGVADIRPAQFAPSVLSLNSESPTPPMWRGLWVPMTYSIRSVPFQLSLGSLGHPSFIYAVDPAFTLPLSLATLTSYDAPINVGIVPAPGSAIVLLLGYTRVRRRRPCVAR